MSSIRSKLLVGTTLAMAGAFLVSGVALYSLVERNFVAEIDRELTAKALLLAGERFGQGWGITIRGAGHIRLCMRLDALEQYFAALGQFDLFSFKSDRLLRRGQLCLSVQYLLIRRQRQYVHNEQVFRGGLW